MNPKARITGRLAAGSKAGRSVVVAAAAGVVLAGAVGTTVWASNSRGSGRPVASATGGYPGGMMGRGYGPSATPSPYPGGMMGGGPGGWMGRWMGQGAYGLAGDGKPVTSLAAARARAQAFADRLGLRAGEVMEFSNGFYTELTSAAGHGATEVLIARESGAVSIEYGPAMMWNTTYGMHPRPGAATQISASQAQRVATVWLNHQHNNLTPGAADAFPGYYTLHTLNRAQITGMMSVNAITGAVWFHTWHGRFIMMSDH